MFSFSTQVEFCLFLSTNVNKSTTTTKKHDNHYNHYNNCINKT